MAEEKRGIWGEIKLLVFIGWAIAVIRLILDVAAPGISMWIGVYYLMPIALLYCSVKGMIRLSWGRMALGMIIVGALVWAVPNMISYTLAQFQGWQFGRFAPDRAGPLAATAGAKLLTGCGTGAATGVAGSIWMIIWGTLLVWLPRYIKQRKGQ